MNFVCESPFSFWSDARHYNRWLLPQKFTESKARESKEIAMKITFSNFHRYRYVYFFLFVVESINKMRQWLEGVDLTCCL